MNLKNIKNKKVTIFGLGLFGGGVGSAKFFAQKGAKVTVTDLKNKQELKEPIEKLKKYRVKFVLGKHREEDFKNTDLVIKGPGISSNSPYLAIARGNKVLIENDVSIFFKLCKVPIVGITGSKGKSTTATLLRDVLKVRFKNALLGGNIGGSMLDLLPFIKKDSIVVLELSSWQLEGLLFCKKSPHIAIITNIFPEHLNRYKSFQEYVEAKKIIFRFQKKNDYLILNSKLKKYNFKTKSQVIYFTGDNKEAVRAVGDIYSLPKERVEKKILNFPGIPGRVEFVREIAGIKFYNDTCATHPEATIYSIKKLKKENPQKEIILIVGGEDKNLDFDRFNEFIEKELKKIVVLPGRASQKIKPNILKFPVADMKEAVWQAKKIAKKGDIALLSPAAASFNLFKNEFDRGNVFKQEVKKIIENEK